MLDIANSGGGANAKPARARSPQLCDIVLSFAAVSLPVLQMRKGTTVKHTAFLLIVSIACTLAAPQTPHAAEGASSNYYPGTYGDLLVALQPKPGRFSGLNYTGYVSSTIDKAVLNDKAAINTEVQQGFVAPLGLYTFKEPILGGATFSVGGWIAVAAASMNTTLITPNFSPDFGTSNSGLATSGLIPAYLSWKLSQNFWLAAYEVVYMPTGSYSTETPLNLNRGYWGFDQDLALTFWHEKTGTELSAVAGLMFNTTNPHTDYWTAPEFHLEYVFNQFLASFVSIGLHGYYYAQIANDQPGPKGAAALNVLNLNASATRSRSMGLGPQLNFVVNDNLAFTLSWIHDLYDHYRLPSNYFYLNTYVQF